MNRTISLPEDLLDKADQLAAVERVSVEQFLSERLTEQFAGLDYLNKRAERASLAGFRAALQHLPDAEPDDYDQF